MRGLPKHDSMEGVVLAGDDKYNGNKRCIAQLATT